MTKEVPDAHMGREDSEEDLQLRGLVGMISWLISRVAPAYLRQLDGFDADAAKAEDIDGFPTMTSLFEYIDDLSDRLHIVGDKMLEEDQNLQTDTPIYNAVAAVGLAGWLRNRLMEIYHVKHMLEPVMVDIMRQIDLFSLPGIPKPTGRTDN